ncbi:MAG: hypothetical protein V1839_02865 [archaeon]
MRRRRLEAAVNIKSIILIAIIFIAIGILINFPQQLGITGMASGSRLTNLSVGVTGANPAIITFVAPPASTTPLETGTINVTFTFTMYDLDGYGDLNDSSVGGNFTLAGEIPRRNITCGKVGNIDTYRNNYSCTIPMYYWDGGGSWSVIAYGSDQGNKTLSANATQVFTYQELKAMTISPSALTWPAVTPGALFQNATNDPTVITNGGNYNSTINITALNLIGDTDINYNIGAANFSVGRTALTRCIGTNMTNGTTKLVVGSIANRGNQSVSGGGLENFYYCMPRVPPILLTQTYSTLNGGGWTITY